MDLINLLKLIGAGIRRGVWVALICGFASPFVLNLAEIVIDVISFRESSLVFIALLEAFVFIVIEAFLAYLYICLPEGVVLELSKSDLLKNSIILVGSIFSSYFVWSPERFSFLSETLIRLVAVLMGGLHFYVFFRTKPT
jgi:hypothetical protein